MSGIILCIAAMFGTFLIARRCFVNGLLAVVTVGYFYGILRANFLVTASHFIFDAAVLGFYAARFKELSRMFVRPEGQRLRHWVTFLIAVPLVLFFIPMQDPLVQLVGLRGNAFLVPFVLVGARLKREEFYRIGVWLAFLNIFAFAVGSAEYLFGIERFFPYSAVTEIIYRSNDVGAANDYRIPSIFANAHSFGGTMVLTVPLLAGAWVQKHREIWHKNLFIAGLLATMLGVFMSAARSHFLVLIVLLTVATFSTRLRPIYRVGWVVVLLLVGYVVSTQARMQRFTTLSDGEFVQRRFQASVNTTLLDAMIEYPFGNGLGGGGTSMPFFLIDRVNMPVAVESEWGRIVLETGLLGLVAWAGFLAWVFSRPQAHRGDPAFLGLRLAWVAAFAFFGFGFIGIGLFTSIPSTAILLMLVGWVATHHTGEADMRLPLRQPATLDPRLILALRQRGLAQRG
jgi:hypothetical protein